MRHLRGWVKFAKWSSDWHDFQISRNEFDAVQDGKDWRTQLSKTRFSANNRLRVV
jgi:hypothetical protein